MPPFNFIIKKLCRLPLNRAMTAYTLSPHETPVILLSSIPDKHNYSPILPFVNKKWDFICIWLADAYLTPGLSPARNIGDKPQILMAGKGCLQERGTSSPSQNLSPPLKQTKKCLTQEETV
jgi:hypothetical protein